MLLRPGTLPLGSGYSYELKWDGFRALVSTVDGLRVRSRRGWDMTALLPELETLPEGLVLDGELVAFADRRPSFPLLCNRLLHRNSDAAVTFVAFDVLYAAGLSATSLPLAERRVLLESLPLDSPFYVGPTFDDGDALFDAVCRDGHEGIVAKRLHDPYKPGERAWVKIKNPGYWRRSSEIESMQKSIERRQRRALLGQ
jgi:bifunctional non-homologous end joining protein LigD